VFALLRESRQVAERVLCLHNVSSAVQGVEVNLPVTLGAGKYVDLVGGRRLAVGSRRPLLLQPYEVLWIERCS
jgi:hypothetical protein